MTEDRFRLDIRKKIFTVPVVRHWHRLLREVVDAPFLKLSKARLDDFEQPGLLEGVPVHGRGDNN